MPKGRKAWSPKIKPWLLLYKFEPGDTIVPLGWTKVTEALHVSKIDDAGNVHASPVGGGFLYKFDPRAVEKYGFRKALPGELDIPYYRAEFYIEEPEPRFKGWTDGHVWNGWAIPYLERDEATRMMEWQNSFDHYKFRWSGDVLVMEDPEYPGEPAPIKPEVIETAEGPKTVYDVSLGWVWGEWEEGRYEEEEES